VVLTSSIQLQIQKFVVFYDSTKDFTCITAHFGRKFVILWTSESLMFNDNLVRNLV